MVPTVSVLLPVGDAAPFLAEALGSVLADPDPGLEVVAVDDGSRDGSASILLAAGERDPRLRIVRTPGLGVARALNLALVLARAEIVVRMDADDRSLPGRTGELRRFLEERPDVAVVGSDVRLHPSGEQPGGMRRYVEWLNAIGEDDLPREIWVESPLAHPAIAARRSRLLAAGGYRSGPFPEDYELWLRLHARGLRLARLHRVLYWWRDHPLRLTRRHPAYLPGGFRRLKARYLVDGPLKDSRQVALWGAGRSGRPFAAALAAAGRQVAAWIEVDPRRIGRQLHGAPVLAVEDLDRVRALPLIVAVGRADARGLIRAELARRGFAELADYWVVA